MIKFAKNILTVKFNCEKETQSMDKIHNHILCEINSGNQKLKDVLYYYKILAENKFAVYSILKRYGTFIEPVTNHHREKFLFTNVNKQELIDELFAYIIAGKLSK